MTLLHVIKYSDINPGSSLELLSLPPIVLTNVYLYNKGEYNKHATLHFMALVMSTKYHFGDFNKRNAIRKHIDKLLLEYEPT